MIQDKLNAVIISMWGVEVGAVTWLEQGYAVFEYTDAIKQSALNVSPITMPFYKPDTTLFSNNRTVSSYMFPELNPMGFKGLPGLLAESLPGKFSTSMFDEYQSRQGRSYEDEHVQMNPVDILCALGKRGMGALEFTSTSNRINNLTGDDNDDLATPVKIEELVTTLKSVLQDRGQMQLSLSDEDDTASEQAFHNLLRVTTSAGGTQEKAVIAMNEATGEILSGQGDVPNDFDYWLLKFDDITDLKPAASKQTTRVEYAYALMARAAKIDISECRLLEENERAHFITRRFDRRRNRRCNNGGDTNTSVKLHIQSLFALAHYDFKQPGVYSYEQAFEIMRQLHLSKSASLELYRRMLFNVFAYNLDDHTKNIAFLMDQTGRWKLAPAFNLTCSYSTGSHKSDGKHDYQHQMSINGKCDNFMREDLIAVGQNLGLPKVERIIDEVKQAVSQWPTFAKRAGLKKKIINDIAKMHRLDI